MFADAHTHIDYCRSEILPEVLTRCREADVGLIICVAMNRRSAEKISRMVETYPQIYGGVGVHPWEEELAQPLAGATSDWLKALCAHPKIVCISEVGLDYNRSPHSREAQMERLREFVRLAKEVRLPLNTHNDRNSDADMLRILQEEKAKEVGGIIHGFRSDWEHARQCLDLGFCLSFGRAITQPENHELLDVARRAPRDRLLIETDSSGANDIGPFEVVGVAERLAEALEMTPAELGELTTGNLKRLLKI